MQRVEYYKYVLVLLILAVFAMLLFYPPVQRARPVGGIDEGRLFLAGATALLQDGDFPITQRTPLYSLLLAATGKITGVDPNQTIPGAHEYGSIDQSDVARGFLDFRFQRWLLWIQFIMWLAALLLIYRSMQCVDPGSGINALAAVLLLIPLSWLLITYIYDPILTQMLLLSGVFCFLKWLHQPDSWKWAAAASFAFSLSALSRPTFQLILPGLAILCVIVLRAAHKVSWQKMRAAFATMILVWITIVCGYSLRNYKQHHFFGVSSAFGLSLTGRAAYFIEKAEPNYPYEVAAFIEIRNQKGNLWGARGIKWLMSQRGMTWPEANMFMAKVCMTAIARAPMRYLVEAGKGFITFHMPYALRGPRPIVLALYAIDFAITILFLLCTMMWISYHLLARFSPVIERPAWSLIDTAILVLQVIYWYCAAISCGIDYGKPEHRYPVMFVMPAMLVLFSARFQIRKYLGAHESRTARSFA